MHIMLTATLWSMVFMISIERNVVRQVIAFKTGLRQQNEDNFNHWSAQNVTGMH